MPESDAMRELRTHTLPGTTSHEQVSLTDVGWGVGGVQIGLRVVHAKQSHAAPPSVHMLPVPGYVVV